MIDSVRTMLLLTATCSTVGCASYPRFPGESSTTAVQLMQDFGVAGRHIAVGPDLLAGNTLRCETKLFITDRTTHKRYFGNNGLLYFQRQGIVAYGFVPIPIGDDDSKGTINPYRYIDGVFVTSACGEPEKLLVTTQKGSGEYTCWISGCRSPTPGWSKWDCTIESGNTLRAERR